MFADSAPTAFAEYAAQFGTYIKSPLISSSVNVSYITAASLAAPRLM